MKIITLILFKAVILTHAVTASFSSELPTIHIAGPENPHYIGKAPFSSRVQVFSPSLSEQEEEFMGHGVAVSSVLVGDHSPLLKSVSITLIPTIELFSSYLKDKHPHDFVILNWSGCTGYPGLSEEILHGLENI